MTRAFAPNGADRFYNLIKLGFYDGVARFYRAVEGFMRQFGLNGDRSVNGAWYRASIPDDPVVKSNTRGFVTFAMAGPNSRSTQVFINYVDKDSRLDSMGFAPFGQVVEGMKVVDSLYKGYGEIAPKGKGSDALRAGREGVGVPPRNFRSSIASRRRPSSDACRATTPAPYVRTPTCGLCSIAGEGGLARTSRSRFHGRLQRLLPGARRSRRA